MMRIWSGRRVSRVRSVVGTKGWRGGHDRGGFEGQGEDLLWDFLNNLLREGGGIDQSFGSEGFGAKELMILCQQVYFVDDLN